MHIPRTTGLTDEQIDAVERDLRCSLPQAFRTFLRRHDGAAPQSNAFDLPGDQSGVRSFVPLLEAAALRDSIEGFPPSAVPIAEDDCGNYVWLDPETGEIRFWDHEVDGDGVLIAKDFDAFIAALRPFHADAPQAGQVLSAWIDPDFLAEQKTRGNG